MLQTLPIWRRYVNMADINSTAQSGVAAVVTSDCRSSASRAPQHALVEMVELLFFAYRDFTGEPDAILQEMGFGRAHHRVLHFVNRNPGLRVADLLNLLRITKQSLARVLKQLVDEGFILQERPASDRRERRLFLTPRGAELAVRLLDIQTQRIATALALANKNGETSAREFLLAMIGEADRNVVANVIQGRTFSNDALEGDAE